MPHQVFHEKDARNGFNTHFFFFFFITSSLLLCAILARQRLPWIRGVQTFSSSLSIASLKFSDTRVYEP